MAQSITPIAAPEVTRTTSGELLQHCERYGQFAIAQTTVRKGLVGGDWLLGVLIEERITTYVTTDEDALPIVAVNLVLDWEWSWGSTAKHRAVASALASVAAGKIVRAV